MPDYASFKDYVHNNARVKQTIRESKAVQSATRALTVEWTRIIDDSVEKFFQTMPKNGGVTKQMHGYSHPRMTRTGFTSEVFLRPYMRDSMFDFYPGRVNVTELYTEGYQVRSDWAYFFRDIPEWGFRIGVHPLEETVRTLSALAASKGVILTLK